MSTSTFCTPLLEVPGIDEASPYKTVSLVLTISIPILLVAQYAVYIQQRKYYVFLRKRSLANVTQLFAGCMMTWGYTALYDYVGSENYPCWIFQVLNYFATPVMACAIVLQTSMYLSEIGVLRMRRTLKDAGDQESLERLKALDNQVKISKFTAARALLAHLRLIIRIRVPKERRFEERLLNLQFVRSHWFNVFWLSVASVPFLVAFFARLATDPKWIHCNGCELSTFDAAFALAIFAFGAIVGETANSYRISKLDALRILRETNLSWRVGYLPIISYSLYLADPASAYASHSFNWRITFLLAAMVLCYIKTTHQLIMARLLTRKLLTSAFLAREDRFEDVQQSKHLRSLFRAHLDNELSSEIYHFIDDVQELRASWEREKDGRQARARQVFDTYIQKRSPMEVNLSYAVREQLLGVFTKGNVDVSCFDDAHNEIKLHLINDGFARFLSKLSQTLLDEERQKQRDNLPRKSKTEVRQKRGTDLLSLTSSPLASTESLV